MILDKESTAILQAVNDLCPNGIYEILSVEDILSALPKKLKIDEKLVREKMEELAKNKFISIKYSDEQEFCVSPLRREIEKNGKDVEEAKATLTENKKWLKRCSLYAFLASFIGALFGGALTYIILNFLVK